MRNDEKNKSYVFENYEVKDFTTSRYSNDRNVLSRIRNGLVTALNLYLPVPKVIVIVLDDDIVRCIDAKDKQDVVLNIEIGTVTEWLAREIERVIQCFNENLPLKAKKPFHPHVLWIAPPTHKFFGRLNNVKRDRQANCLNTIVKLRDNQSVLKMLKVWNHDDSCNFVYDSYRFTTQGLVNYWMSIDSAIRYWDVAIYPKLGISTPKNKQKFKPNKYKWKKSNFTPNN